MNKGGGGRNRIFNISTKQFNSHVLVWTKKNNIYDIYFIQYQQNINFAVFKTTD